MLPFLTKANETKAKLVKRGGDETIVAAFSDSVQPCLFHMNLVKNPDFSLQVAEQDGAWVLGYTVPGKVFTSIAQFVTREEADLAFLSLRAALLRNHPRPRQGVKVSWLLLALLALILALYFGVGGGARKSASVGEGVASALSKTSGRVSSVLSSSTPKEPEEGVPVSADDVLKPPVE